MSETAKVKHLVQDYVQGFGIDIGCSNDKIKPTALGLDMIHYPCTTITKKLDDLKLFGDKQFDFVYSSHFLEHIESPVVMLSEMHRVLISDGFLVLYLPDPNRYTEDNPVHNILWTPKGFKKLNIIKSKFKRIVFDDKSFDYSYLYVGQKR